MASLPSWRAWSNSDAGGGPKRHGGGERDGIREMTQGWSGVAEKQAVRESWKVKTVMGDPSWRAPRVLGAFHVPDSRRP